jgi:nucleoside-diphosphate-sugar epimerase
VRVLLTGATGYIGGRVAAELSAAGHQVVAVARSDSGERQLRALGHTTARGDLGQPSSLVAAAAGCDGVVHLAATQDDGMETAELASVRAFLTGLAAGTAFVYTSGVWVYPSAPPGELLDERSATDPVSLYAWRPALEAEVVAAARLRTIVIRPAMVYGRGGGPLTQFSEMADDDGVPRYVGGGANHWTLVHVDDLAQLYRLALERAVAGTLLNGAVGEPVAVRDLAAADSAGRGLAGPRAWPADEAAAVDGVTRDHRISGERARTLLGWRPPARAPLDELRAVRSC